MLRIARKDNGGHQGGCQGSLGRTMEGTKEDASKRMLEFLIFLLVYLNDKDIVNHDKDDINAKSAKKHNKNHNVN
jgi:hypothetical protein